MNAFRWLIAFVILLVFAVLVFGAALTDDKILVEQGVPAQERSESLETGLNIGWFYVLLCVAVPLGLVFSIFKTKK